MNAPAYQGIKDFILARIHAGEWGEGDQVPSVSSSLLEDIRFATADATAAK